MPGLKRQGTFVGGKAKIQKVVAVSQAKGDVLELKRQQTILGSEIRKLKAGIETKYHDENSSPGIVNSVNNEFSILCDPQQGSTVATRDGDEISPKSLSIDLHLRHNGSGLGYQAVRVLIIQAKERFVPDTRTSTPSNTAVLSLGGSGAQALLSKHDWNNRKHYTVLHDKTYMVESVDTQQIYAKIRCKLARKIRFAEAGSITAERGQIYMVRYSTEGVNGPYMAWHSRVTFTDA